VIVQVNVSDWIPSYLIHGLAFIAFEADDAFDHDCTGMCHFYVAKYCVESGIDVVTIIPKHECPPFAGQIDKFSKVWSADFCRMAFLTIQHIRQEVQKMLWQVAQSQGNFAARNAKVLHLPSCAWWCFINDAMADKGVDSIIASVKFSRPRVSLSWSLSYCSRRHTGYHLDILRFNTDKNWTFFEVCLMRWLGMESARNVLDTVMAPFC
jgi:hypothetical protein